MANFEDSSGVVACTTIWGQWFQTMEEVFVEVDLPDGTRAKDIKCTFKPCYLSVSVHGKDLIEVCKL
jgi:hypothetical protein